MELLVILKVPTLEACILLRYFNIQNTPLVLSKRQTFLDLLFNHNIVAEAFASHSYRTIETCALNKSKQQRNCRGLSRIFYSICRLLYLPGFQLSRDANEKMKLNFTI